MAPERDSGLPVRAFFYTLESHVEVHWHEFYEVALIVAGEGTHVLNGIVSPLRPGSIFLLTPADFHDLVPRDGGYLQLYNLIFSPDVLDGRLYDMLFGEPRSYAARLSGQTLREMEDGFRRIRSEIGQRGIGYSVIVRGALERVLVDLARNSRGGRQMEDGWHPGLRRALIYVNHYFREPLTLEGVARQAHLSANYFSGRFRDATGSTFQSYLQGLRLRFARSLLAASNLPVGEVCRASGFNSLPHFERAFKQRFGRTPGSCRRASGPRG